MAQDTNAAYQMGIWDLPESVRLQEQTLDKLARALPALLGVPSDEVSNSLTDIIRPLLDDLVQAESFAEVRAAGDRPAEFALALKLSADRMALWQTNLAALSQAMSKSNAETMQRSRSVLFSVVGDWMAVGLGTEAGTDLTDFVSRFSITNQPASDTKEPWIVADADLGWWMRSNAVFSSRNLPAVHLTMSGEGPNVRTRAELKFPESLDLELSPWQAPTNLVHDPLVSFTALRGMTKGLMTLGVWNELPLDFPSQLFTWSMGGIPLQTYLAFPDPEASNRVDRLTRDLHERTHPYFATNSFGRLERTTNGGLNWMDFPFLPASLDAVQVPAGSFVVAGWAPLFRRANRSAPPELLAQFLPRTNLVYYDWELTEARVDAWTYLAQTLRLTTRRAQLPPDCAAQKWLRAMSSKLGNSVTAMEKTGDQNLSFTRTSSIGLTGLELHLLADWLESPDFPEGIHSINSQPDHRLYRAAPQAGAKQTNDSRVRPDVPP